MKKILIIFILSFGFLTGKLYSQIAVSYYPFQSILSVSSNADKLLWADFRLEANTFFSNINLELDGMINLKRTEMINYYSGIGINVNPFYTVEGLEFVNGFTFNFGVQIKPLQKHKKFHIIFEVGPYFNKYFDGGTFRTLLGVSYNL
jgi:hypothetical protein